jgi:hypothetical protein
MEMKNKYIILIFSLVVVVILIILIFKAFSLYMPNTDEIDKIDVIYFPTFNIDLNGSPQDRRSTINLNDYNVIYNNIMNGEKIYSLKVNIGAIIASINIESKINKTFQVEVFCDETNIYYKIKNKWFYI